MKTLRNLAAVCAVVATTLLLTTGPAVAHASLRSSDPSDGDTLAEAPSEIVLEFSEVLDPPSTQVALVAPSGQTVDLPDPVIDGHTLTQSAEFPAAGEYTFSYRIVSADGHPVEGSIGFSVESVPETTTGVVPSAGSPTADPTAAETTPPTAAADTADGLGWGTVGLVAAGAAVLVAGAVLLWRRLR